MTNKSMPIMIANDNGTLIIELGEDVSESLCNDYSKQGKLIYNGKVPSEYIIDALDLKTRDKEPFDRFAGEVLSFTGELERLTQTQVVERLKKIQKQGRGIPYAKGEIQ